MFEATQNKSIVTKLYTRLYQLAWASWLGAMVFFAFLFAPRVFRILERQAAADIQLAIFTPYYTLGVICCVVMIVCLIVLKNYAYRRLRLGMLALSLAGLIYSRQSVVPELSQLQAQVLLEERGSTATPESARFQSLHKTSVRINAAILFFFLVL